MDVEAMLLEKEYNENWLQHEGTSLEMAFKSQLARLEGEWAAAEGRVAVLEGALAAAEAGGREEARRCAGELGALAAARDEALAGAQRGDGAHGGC